MWAQSVDLFLLIFEAFDICSLWYFADWNKYFNVLAKLQKFEEAGGTDTSKDKVKLQTIQKVVEYVKKGSDYCAAQTYS